MSCDRDRKKWWGYFGRWSRNHLSKSQWNDLKQGAADFIKSKMEDALKGNSGPKYSGRSSNRRTGSVSGRGKSKSGTGKTAKETKAPLPKPALDRSAITQATPEELMENIYDRVKQAALVRENDLNTDKRDEMALKARKELNSIQFGYLPISELKT